MNFSLFHKHLTELVDCCSVSVSSKVKVYLPRIFEDQVEDLVYRLVCREKNNGVLCTVYYSTLPPRDKLVLTRNDIVNITEQINRKICPGVPESVARTEVDKGDIVIQKVGDEFIYRSRRCESTVQLTIDKCCISCKELPDPVKRKPPSQQVNCTVTTCEEKFLSNAALNKHLQAKHGDVLKCDFENCGKQFGSKKNLDYHIKRHLKDFSHFCNYCDKGFVSSCELKSHISVHEKKECDSNKHTLTEPMSVHSENRTKSSGNSKEAKTYPCDLCSKSFSAINVLNLHKKVHTGEKSYTCRFCEKKFATPSGLKGHMRVHVRGYFQSAAPPQGIETSNMPNIMPQTFIVQSSFPAQQRRDQELRSAVFSISSSAHTPAHHTIVREVQQQVVEEEVVEQVNWALFIVIICYSVLPMAFDQNQEMELVTNIDQYQGQC